MRTNLSQETTKNWKTAYGLKLINGSDWVDIFIYGVKIVVDERVLTTPTKTQDCVSSERVLQGACKYVPILILLVRNQNRLWTGQKPKAYQE